jgi:hypothetical protein
MKKLKLKAKTLVGSLIHNNNRTVLLSLSPDRAAGALLSCLFRLPESINPVKAHEAIQNI